MKLINNFAIILFVVLAVSSCNEQRRTIYQVDLGISVSDRIHIDNVNLYLFDDESRLIGSQQGNAATWFDVAQYETDGRLGVVVWGNIDNSGVDLMSVQPPFLRSSHRVVVEDSTASFAGHQLSRTPPDLFFGAMDVEFVEQYDDHSVGNNRYIIGKIPLRRVVASFAVTVRNASASFGTPASDLTLLVRSPYSGLNFSGIAVGSAIYTVPRSTFDAAADELKTAVNIALATGDSSIVVEIYRADELLFSTASSTDTAGLKFAADTFHHIIIDKHNQSTINVIPAHWGEQSLDGLFD